MNLENKSSVALDFERDRLKRFRKLVKYANANSPYYAKIIRENCISIDSSVPEDFPVLTKSIAMEHFDDIVTDRKITKKEIEKFVSNSSDPRELFLNKYTALVTSGSSGEEGYFVSHFKDTIRGLSSISPAKVSTKISLAINYMRWLFTKRKKPAIAFYGNVSGHYAGYDSAIKWPKLLFNAKGFEINQAVSKTVEDINQFQPNILCGYTTMLKILAEEKINNNLSISPQVIIATAETVTKDDLIFLNKVFPASHVMSLYASSEHGNMGRSNRDKETMSLFDDKLIFEFFEDHTLVTNLCNYTMPLIRYKMSDVLVPISEKNTYPTIAKNLISRTETKVYFRNSLGETESFTSFITRRFYVKGVSKFQMQVTSDTSFLFPVCLESHLTEEEKSDAIKKVETSLVELLHKKNLDNVSFDVFVVKAIPVNKKTRKFQLIVDKTE